MKKLQTFGHFFGTTTLGSEAIPKHHRIWSKLTLLAFLIYFASYYKCSRNQRSRKEAFFVQAFIGSDISLTLISCMLQISMIYYIPPPWDKHIFLWNGVAALVIPNKMIRALCLFFRFSWKRASDEKWSFPDLSGTISIFACIIWPLIISPSLSLLPDYYSFARWRILTTFYS